MAGGAGDDDGPGHEVAAGHFVEQPASVRGDGVAEVGMQKIVAEEGGGNTAKLDGHTVDGVRMAAAAKEGGEGVAHWYLASAARAAEGCLFSIFLFVHTAPFDGPPPDGNGQAMGITHHNFCTYPRKNSSNLPIYYEKKLYLTLEKLLLSYLILKLKIFLFSLFYLTL